VAILNTDIGFIGERTMPLPTHQPLVSTLALALTCAVTLAAWHPTMTLGSPARPSGRSTLVYASVAHAPSTPIVLM
jgi:hypothetical protein